MNCPYIIHIHQYIHIYIRCTRTHSGVLELAYVGSWDWIVNISIQMCIHWCHLCTLKSAIVESVYTIIFNSNNNKLRLLFFLEIWLSIWPKQQYTYTVPCFYLHSSGGLIWLSNKWNSLFSLLQILLSLGIHCLYPRHMPICFHSFFVLHTTTNKYSK